MLNLRNIHKPTTLADALKLLQQPNTVALAGGTQLLADQRRDVYAVVDLSALDLAYIRERDGAVVIGAMTTLAALDSSPILRALANGIVAQAAHRSASSILRNQATIGGTLIAEPAGILATALVALDARVTIVGADTRTLMLTEFLPARAELVRGALVTEITVALTHPRAVIETVARTPSDKPIVCVAAAAQIEKGIAREVRVALGGVSETALRAYAAEQMLEGYALDTTRIEETARLAARDLSPPSDFRGSAVYRREMARVLIRRAVNQWREP